MKIPSKLKYQEATIKQRLNLEIKNSYENYTRIKLELSTGKSSAFRQNVSSGPAMVCASGSSLDDFLPLVKDWHGPIFCTGSQLSSLWHAGARNIFCLSLDAGTPVSQYRQATIEACSQSTLLAHPGSNPNCLKYWPGPKRYFQTTDNESPHYANIAMAYPKIDFQFLNFASSAPLLVSAAHAMGHSPIFLTGFDFSAERFLNNAYYEDGVWIGHASCGGEDAPGVILAENGVKTTEQQLYYMKSFLMSIALYTPPVIMCSDRTAVSQLPVADIQKVVKRGGKKLGKLLPGKMDLRKRIERWLLKHGTYLVRVRKDGARMYKYVEAENVLDIAAMMRDGRVCNEDITNMINHTAYLNSGTRDTPFYKDQA